MELEEYIQKQKNYHELYNEARQGDQWYSHDTSSKIMDQMIKLEQDYFLEHLDEYAEDCETKFVNGRVEVTGPNGDYLFSLSLTNLTHFKPNSPVKDSLEKLGIKTSDVVISDDRNSNSINWGPDSDQEVSNILNHTLLLESKYMDQNNTESSPPIANKFKQHLNDLKQNSTKNDSVENDLDSENRFKPR